VSTVEAYASKIPLLAETAGKPGQLGIVVRSMEDALASWGAEGHFAPGWRLWTYSPNTVELSRTAREVFNEDCSRRDSASGGTH